MNTHGQNVDLMKHALGKTPDSRHDLYQTYNRAGRFLHNYVCQDGTPADWSWRLRNTTLTTTINVELIPLPTDFESVVSIRIPGVADILELTDLSAVHRARTRDVGGTGRYFLAIPPVDTFHATTGALTQKSAVIWPLPPSNGVPELDLWYHAAWVDVTVADAAKFPRIPPEFEEALILLARDAAISLEDQSVSLEGSRGAAALERLRIIDDQRQPQLGRMVGGATTRRRSRFDSDRRYPPTLDL